MSVVRQSPRDRNGFMDTAKRMSSGVLPTDAGLCLDNTIGSKRRVGMQIDIEIIPL